MLHIKENIVIEIIVIYCIITLFGLSKIIEFYLSDTHLDINGEKLLPPYHIIIVVNKGIPIWLKTHGCLHKMLYTICFIIAKLLLLVYVLLVVWTMPFAYSLKYLLILFMYILIKCYKLIKWIGNWLYIQECICKGTPACDACCKFWCNYNYELEETLTESGQPSRNQV